MAKKKVKVELLSKRQSIQETNFRITCQDSLTASGSNGENGAPVHATMECWSRLGHGKSYKSHLARVKSAMEVTRTQRLVARGHCGADHAQPIKTYLM